MRSCRTSGIDIDVAVVLVTLADAVEILLQLRLIQPAGLVEEGDGRYRLGLHLAPQDAIAEFGVALELNRADRALFAFVDRVNGAGRAAAFIRHELHARRRWGILCVDKSRRCSGGLPQAFLHQSGDGTRNLIWSAQLTWPEISWHRRFRSPLSVRARCKNNLDAYPVADRSQNADVLDLDRWRKASRISCSTVTSEYGWPTFVRIWPGRASLATVSGPTYCTSIDDDLHPLRDA